MTHRRITQADVAALAGVSPTAVSLVLNDRAGTRLSDSAATRIRQAAEQLGYRPNLTARALSTQRSAAIGFVSDLAAISREANGMVKGALQAARESKHTLFIAETEGDPEAEQEAIEALVGRQVDGLIYAVARAREVAVPAAAQRTRLVLLNATSATEALSVLPDEHEGGRKVVRLLVDHGHHRRIAVLGADAPNTASDKTRTITVRRRVAGMWDAFNEHRIVPQITISRATWELEDGYTAMRHLLRTDTVPRALICLNDRLAFGASRAIAEAGLQVPTDISIVSFDDDVISQYVQPPLTTAALPYAEMGRLAVQLLLDQDTDHHEYLVPMPVRLRESVGPA